MALDYSKYRTFQQMPYSGQYAFNTPFNLANTAEAGFDTLRMPTHNTLTNHILEREYNAQHPFKKKWSDFTGASSGYDPLVGMATDAAFDVGVDKAFSKKGAKTASGNGGLKNFYTNKIVPNFGWSKSSGIKAFGKNVGKWGNIAGNRN